jgi:CBS domain-containing protein
MTNKLPSINTNERIAREIERERHERVLHDEARAGLAGSEEFRIKDARESMNGNNVRRTPVR